MSRLRIRRFVGYVRSAATHRDRLPRRRSDRGSAVCLSPPKDPWPEGEPHALSKSFANKKLLLNLIPADARGTVLQQCCVSVKAQLIWLTISPALADNDRRMCIQRRGIDGEKLRPLSRPSCDHVRTAAVGAGAVGAPGVLEKIELLKRGQAGEVAGIKVINVGGARAELGIARWTFVADYPRGLGIQHFVSSQPILSNDWSELIARRIGACLELHRA